MKKILIIISLFIFLPFTVLADFMEPPKALEQDVIVINEEGTPYYEFNNPEIKIGTLKKGEVVKTNYIDTLRYDMTSVVINQNFYLIYTKDIMSLEEEYQIDASDKVVCSKTNLYHPCNVIVLLKNGIDVYSGPSRTFKKVGTIPYKTEIKILYSVNGVSNWFYVEYNGVKGWVSSIFGELGYDIKDDDPEIFLPAGWEIYDFNGINTQIGTINENILTRNYYNTIHLDDNDDIYIFYDGIEGHVYGEFPYKLEENLKVKINSNKNIYDKIHHLSGKPREDSKALLEIPAGTNLELESPYVSFYPLFPPGVFSIEYNGVKGWIYLDENDFNDEENDYINEEINVNKKGIIKSNKGNGVNLRAKAGTSYDKIGGLADGEEVIIVAESAPIDNTNANCEYWYKIEYKDSYAYVCSNLVNIIEKPIDMDDNSNNQETTDDSKIKHEKNTTPIKIIFSCIYIAIIISLCAFIIMFINRKKKKNDE